MFESKRGSVNFFDFWLILPISYNGSFDIFIDMDCAIIVFSLEVMGGGEGWHVNISSSLCVIVFTR